MCVSISSAVASVVSIVHTDLGPAVASRGSAVARTEWSIGSVHPCAGARSAEVEPCCFSLDHQVPDIPARISPGARVTHETILIPAVLPLQITDPNLI